MTEFRWHDHRKATASRRKRAECTTNGAQEEASRGNSTPASIARRCPLEWVSLLNVGSECREDFLQRSRTEEENVERGRRNRLRLVQRDSHVDLHLAMHLRRRRFHIVRGEEEPSCTNLEAAASRKDPSPQSDRDNCFAIRIAHFTRRFAAKSSV